MEKKCVNRSDAEGRWRLVTGAAVLIVCFVGCYMGCERSQFECAKRFGTNEGDVTRCDRPRERCVCATRSCAVPVPASACDAGYQHVAPPFGDESCVKVTDVPKDEDRYLADEETGLCNESAADAGLADGSPADGGGEGGGGGAK